LLSHDKRGKQLNKAAVSPSVQAERAWASTESSVDHLCSVPLDAATSAILAEQARREAEALAEKASVDHLSSTKQQIPSWDR